MDHKELTKQVQDLIVGKYQSEESNKHFQGFGYIMEHYKDNNQKVEKTWYISDNYKKT